MKKQLLCYSFYILLSASLVSCNEFIRTEVEHTIYVNRKTFSGFVGDEVQLTASPSGESYSFKWTSENPEVAQVSNNGLVTLTGEGFTNIVLSAGTLKTNVEISSKLRIPLTNIILNESALDLFIGDTKSLSFIKVPETANDVGDAQWSSENPLVASVNEKGDVAAIGVGETNLIVKVNDVTKQIPVEVSNSKPFNGVKTLTHGAVLTINAADFDFGGPGIAFNDDAANPLGESDYRRSKGDTQSGAVEIEGNGNNLGYVNAGEWYQYTVMAVVEGNHYMDFSMSGHSVGVVHVEVNGVDVTGPIQIPANGSWSNWTTYPASPFVVPLKKGKNKIKIVVDQAGFNFKSFRMAYL